MHIIKLYHKNVVEGELRSYNYFPNDEDIRQFVIKQILSKPYIDVDYIDVMYKRGEQKNFSSLRKGELDKLISGIYDE